ncbi:MAG: hypothetical protein HC800_23295 [Phormidesmis sp. RL_2_1]|nr:hypothetical protein [Phormidesmis sp. RL_2_1]
MFTRLPVAWLNLTYKPGRLMLSLGGIIFAAVLMFMFVGFKHALYDSQLRLLEQLNGDVFLIHSRRASLIAPVQFPAEILYQAETESTISKAFGLYLGRAVWRNANGKSARTVRLIAYNPNANLFKFPEIRQHLLELQLPNTVLVDRFARAEIGQRQRGVVTELGDRYVQVVGNFSLGNDFAAYSGNVITSEDNFLRYQTSRDAKQLAARSTLSILVFCLSLLQRSPSKRRLPCVSGYLATLPYIPVKACSTGSLRFGKMAPTLDLSLAFSHLWALSLVLCCAIKSSMPM